MGGEWEQNKRPHEEVDSCDAGAESDIEEQQRKENSSSSPTPCKIPARKVIKLESEHNSDEYSKQQTLCTSRHNISIDCELRDNIEQSSQQQQQRDTKYYSEINTPISLPTGAEKKETTSLATTETSSYNNNNNNIYSYNNTTNSNATSNMNKQTAVKQSELESKKLRDCIDPNNQHDDDNDEDLDEEDVVEEEEEVEEEVTDEEDDDNLDEAGQQKSSNSSANNRNTNSSSNNANSSNNAGTDKRPRLTAELYDLNLKRKLEHVGSALYIPFPRKVTEEEVRGFVGQGPNIFLVGIQKLNAIVRYRTRTECEEKLQELSKKEFEGQTLAIEPKTIKIDPANIDVKTLIVQYSNPSLTIMDFAQIFIKAISISLKGGKSKKESQEDLSFGSAIIIFPSHEEAKEAFLATENLNIKNEQLRVVFADFRPAGGSSTRTTSGPFNFRKTGGDGGNRGNFSRGNRGGDRQGGSGGGGGNYRRRNTSGGGGSGNSGSQRNFGNRNFNQNSGSSYNQGRNYSPNKKFRSNR